MKTRKEIFETNSSSTHSISICEDIKNYVMDYIEPDGDGNIILTGGSFGWAWEKFDDAKTKANYCAQAISEMEKYPKEALMLAEVISEQTGANEIIFDFGYGYVDHQSEGVAFEAFSSKETLRNFIFNKNSILWTGNDNDDTPPGWFS